MILIARAVVRLVSFVLLVVLALAGLALAIGRIGTGTSGPSLGGLASAAHLASVRDSIGSWLHQLEAGGSIASIAALCGLGAILVGVLLLIGVLVPRRERLVTLSADTTGTLAARRRPLGQAAQELAERVRGVTEARVKVRPGRRSGGRIRVRASRPRAADPKELRAAITEQLRALTDPFKLKARIEVARRGARVQ